LREKKENGIRITGEREKDDSLFLDVEKSQILDVEDDFLRHRSLSCRGERVMEKTRVEGRRRCRALTKKKPGKKKVEIRVKS
jgi:hypothetical protein